MTTNEQSPTAADAGQPERPKDPLAVFRRFPTGLVVFLGLIGAGGVALFLANNAKEVVARCGNEVMVAGDICETRSRRSFNTTTWTYEERLAFAEAQNQGAIVAGLVVVLIAVIAIAAVVTRWRRDVAVANQLASQEAPLTAFADSTGVGTGFLTLVAGLLGGFGAFLAVGASGSKGSPVVGLVLGGLMLVAALGVLWVGRPKGCTLVWAYPSAVRVVTESRVHDVPWQDMQYLATLGKDRSEWLSWAGRKSSLGIQDKEFFAVMQRTINGAAAASVRQRFEAGETIDFGDVKVSSSAIVLKKKQFPVSDIRGITVMRDKNGTYYEFRDQQIKVAGSVGVQTVANSDVLFDLLAKRLNITFLNN
ncbi:DUF6585 family protein [Occultella gossypii]|uniref:Uncharacterized protein n=1 Tax=Occultella gossypii TaxID=2800820 RepID=A0ABS7S5X0_9MICO|nr:DUF6585 family protein [Occultella gossypii]MBZ2195024.1 hypothetical protein [Occultella gossypii]